MVITCVCDAKGPNALTAEFSVWGMMVLYLNTLNLGKWIEFLMNTVKLMASTNGGSLVQKISNA